MNKARGYIVVVVAFLLGMLLASAGASNQGVLPFHANIQIGGVEYEVDGEAVILTTHTPTPPADELVGGYGWGYTFDWWCAGRYAYLLGVPVPSQLYAAGYEWADLDTCAFMYGPSQSQYAYLSQMARALMGQANTLIYVPESRETSPSVPLEETLYLEQYLADAIDLADQYDYIVAYGPGLTLFCDPDTYVTGKVCDVDYGRMQTLAGMMPVGSVWILRVKFYESLYQNDLTQFQQHVQALADNILLSNPDMDIVVHLSLPPGGCQHYLSMANLLPYPTYMGVHPTMPQSLQDMECIWTTTTY
jgi:hypothetical protein